MEKIRVLVVDDSALMRKMIKELLQTDRQIEVIGVARDGEDAIIKAIELRPDVITMDINMPKMDGLTSMQYILEEFPDMAVLMISSLSEEGALITFEALELGAFDYVAKPSGTVSSDIYLIGKEIIQKVKAAYQYKKKAVIRNKILGKRNSDQGNKEAKDNQRSTPLLPKNLSKIVVIGISTGGPGTLMDVVPYIPKDLNACILIIQHMPPAFTSSFAKRLDQVSPFSFKEAEEGDEIMDGRGYIAPGGYHLMLREKGAYGEFVVRLSKQPDLLYIPSVDVTMKSVLSVVNPRKIIGVLMTGMGDDGADAMVQIRKAGGMTIAEAESTAVVFGMPREAIERGGAEMILPSYKIADEIIKAVDRFDFK